MIPRRRSNRRRHGRGHHLVVERGGRGGGVALIDMPMPMSMAMALPLLVLVVDFTTNGQAVFSVRRRQVSFGVDVEGEHVDPVVVVVRAEGRRQGHQVVMVGGMVVVVLLVIRRWGAATSTVAAPDRHLAQKWPSLLFFFNENKSNESCVSVFPPISLTSAATLQLDASVDLPASFFHPLVHWSIEHQDTVATTTPTRNYQRKILLTRCPTDRRPPLE